MFRSCWVVAALMIALGAEFARAQERPLRQVIDQEIESVWKQEKIAPAGPAADGVFLRRVFLDLVGVIPSYEETTAFLQDTDAAKRDKLIAKLLDDPRFAAHQAATWDLTLFGRNPAGYDATRKREAFKKWLGEQFGKNVPYDRWVRDLMLAEHEGPALYHVQFRGQPEEATVAVTKTFLGTQLQCARCHDHPFESWTQKDFYGMAGFFVRLVVLDPAGKMKDIRIAEKSTGEVLFSGPVQDQRPGKKGEPVKPKFLGGPHLVEPELPKDFKEPAIKPGMEPTKPQFSRKEKLAEWLTAADNPYFARAAANRVWAQFMGRGLVHPVDDLSEKNKPSHRALLDALTKGLKDHKFDLKWLIGELVRSGTYQQGDAGPATAALPEKFERARVRPLTAEELLASLIVATKLDGPALKNLGASEYFVMYFGEPNDGQGHFQGSLREHLFLNNSGHIRTMIQQRKGNLADTILTSKESWEEKVERMFLSVLSRPPSSAERERFVQHLSGDAKMAPQLLEEALWVLVSCSEFRFNR